MQQGWGRYRATLVGVLEEATKRKNHHHHHVRRTWRYYHNSSEQVLSLKTELRRLFKLVHPDLFHNSPNEQATNQRSFQLLQEYLDVAKGKESPQRPSYHFEFYIKEYEATSNKRVELFLPPPQIRHHPQRGKELSPLTKVALGRLLSACGLSSEVSGHLEGSENNMNLFEFFQHASEIQRQSEASLLNLEQQVRVVKSALQVGRRITILFRRPLSDATCQEQLQVLENLARAVDEIQRVELAGCVLIIGDGYGVDDGGNVWLNCEDDARSWAKYLGEVNWTNVSSCQSAAKARRLKEFQVAQLLEVEMIFADDSLVKKLEYLFFLDQLADNAIKNGAVGSGKFYELPIRVTSPSIESDIPNTENKSSNKNAQLAIDENMGYISVSVVESPLNLHKFIEEHGEEALKVRRRFKLLEKQMEDLKAHVRKHLRLRHLAFDETLKSDQLQSACMRLLRNARLLQKHTEGLGICISAEHHLPLPGSKGLVYLKWDFSLTNL
ncbi:hypothetical protein O6H91_08G047200 [Diphasiastrum complanatum]|uniref:Uncharacterized protein n=2 Tax=Diphasiastrum complanatum TaxID=34168 RepID=A0ACC2CX62_DIPCM|nr:hypothetical protein O6H91_08G047200 [Diphasiastrum complanatum]